MIFHQSEAEIFLRPENLPLVEWSEKHIELSRMTSAYSGRYSFDMVPFFKAIANAIDDPNIQQINIRKSTQIGGTQLMVNALAKWAALDPSSAMLCLADQGTAIEIIEDRVQPTFKRCEVIKRNIIPEKFNQDEIRLRNDFLLKTAWASSISKTASRPIRYLIMDEITKPGYTRVGSEGDAIDRIIQRTETFSNKKIILLSTVTTEGDNMYRQEELCDEIYLFFVPCPDCGSYQPLFMRPTEYIDENGEKKTSGYISFDASEDDHVKAAKEAMYCCNECNGLWDTIAKNNAVQHCMPVPQKNTNAEPSNVTFVISRLYSLFNGGRLDVLTKDFMKSKDDPLLLQSFVNNALSEYWVEVLKRANEQTIANAIDHHLDIKRIPDGCIALVATIDVQKRGFWYILRAWDKAENSYLMDYGFLADWKAVDELVFNRSYDMGKGQQLQVWRCGIDIGGGERESGEKTTDEVYTWILANQYRGVSIFPCKGSSKELSGRIKLSETATKTKAGKVGLKILSIDTNKCKDAFVWRLENAAEHKDFSAYLPPNTDKVYFSQIQAEEKRRDRKTRKMKWVPVSKNNHLFDCEQMQIALTDKLLFGGVAALNGPAIRRSRKKSSTQVVKKKQPANNPWKNNSW